MDCRLIAAETSLPSGEMFGRALPFLPLLFTLACDSGDDEPDEMNASRIDTIEALSGKTADGQTTFASTCGSAACHGADGNTPGAATTPTLADEVPGLSDRELIGVVINGYETMPPQSSLKDQQVADVLAYSRATFK